MHIYTFAYIYTHTHFSFNNGKERQGTLIYKVSMFFLKKTPWGNPIYLFTSQENKMIGKKPLPCRSQVWLHPCLNILYLRKPAHQRTVTFYFLNIKSQSCTLSWPWTVDRPLLRCAQCKPRRTVPFSLLSRSNVLRSHWAPLGKRTT